MIKLLQEKKNVRLKKLPTDQKYYGKVGFAQSVMGQIIQKEEGEGTNLRKNNLSKMKL